MAKLSKKTQQIYLQRLGLYCGLIDGKQGKLHSAALKEVKKKAGLKVNTAYDTATDKALRNQYAKRDKKKLSKHFSASEFACHCNGKYCDGHPAKEVSPKLIGILEKIRTTAGGSVTVTSGERCKMWNAKQSGSSSKSTHMSGKAADIVCGKLSRAKIKQIAYASGAAYCYYGTRNMGNAVHINV